MDILESVTAIHGVFPADADNPYPGIPKAIRITFSGSFIQWHLNLSDARKLHAALGDILHDYITTDDESGIRRPRRDVNPRAPRK